MDETDTANTIIRPRAHDAPGHVPRAHGVVGGSPFGALLRSDIDADTVIGQRANQRVITDAQVSTHTRTAPVSEAMRPTVKSVHRVAINGGEPVRLDVPQIIGRHPRQPRVATGAGAHLVTVASPRGEVSATHVEVSQVGTSIVITDLRSTNGTVVMMPGSAPITMRSGESLVVVPGTIVQIGDGCRIEVLLPPRLRPSDQNASEFAR